MPHAALGLCAFALVAAAVALGVSSFAGPGSAGGPSAEARARAVAARFFAAINAQRYDEACGLLSRSFYRENHVRDRRSCAIGLAAGMGANKVRFEIRGVRRRGENVVVAARADGAPGTVVLT